MRLLCSILLIMSILTGCASTMRREQTIDGLTIALEHSSIVPINTDQELLITLHDELGNPVNDAIVALDLVMPGMPMGQNKPLADPLGDGRYKVHALYTMTGNWTIYVRVNHQGKQYVATFEQAVVA